MIVQAIGLLDDLDKELNTYAMRVREWYGWHFPEMTRVVTDNIQYALSVRLFQLPAVALQQRLIASGCTRIYARLHSKCTSAWGRTHSRLDDSEAEFLLRYSI